MNFDIWGSPLIATGGQEFSQILLGGGRPKLSWVQGSLLCPILLGENAPRERKVTLDSVKHRGGLWHSTPFPSSDKLLALLWKFTEASGLEAGAERDKPTSDVANRWASPRLKSISNRPNDWLIERRLCVRANQTQKLRRKRRMALYRIGSTMLEWKSKQLQAKLKEAKGVFFLSRPRLTAARYWPLLYRVKCRLLFPNKMTTKHTPKKRKKSAACLCLYQRCPVAARFYLEIEESFYRAKRSLK